MAKDAADIILLEPSLAVLHDGIIEGRRAFGNVMKYLLMGTSSNFGNMFSMAGGVALPAVPADAADADPAEQLPLRPLADHHPRPTTSTRATSGKPHKLGHRAHPAIHAVHRSDQLGLRLPDVLRAALRYFHASPRLFHTGWFVESLATQTLVIFVIRTMGNPLKSRPSAALAATTTAIVVVGATLPSTPLGRWLGFETLPLSYLLYVAIATLTYLLLVEVVKARS